MCVRVSARVSERRETARERDLTHFYTHTYIHTYTPTYIHTYTKSEGEKKYKQMKMGLANRKGILTQVVLDLDGTTVARFVSIRTITHCGLAPDPSLNVWGN